MSRRVGCALALTAAFALVGCGADEGDGGSTVAKAVAPPSAPTDDAARSTPTTTGSAGDSAAPVSQYPTATRAARGRQPERGGRRILSNADRASFVRLAGSLSGAEGLAVSALGLGQGVERMGSLRSAVAWSTSKVPIAMAVIASGAGEAQQADLRAAITASDNAAAVRLWNSLGGGAAAAKAAEEQLAEAGDSRTDVERRSLRGGGFTPFGQTRWSLTDQTRFVAGMACSQPGAQVLGLMNEVVAAQRWGLGAAGVEAQSKAGWGPGSEPGVGGGYMDRQMGVVTIDGKPLAVTLATRPSDGAHATGTRNLTALARWLVEHASVDTVRAEPRC